MNGLRFWARHSPSEHLRGLYTTETDDNNVSQGGMEGAGKSYTENAPIAHVALKALGKVRGAGIVAKGVDAVLTELEDGALNNVGKGNGTQDGRLPRPASRRCATSGDRKAIYVVGDSGFGTPWFGNQMHDKFLDELMRQTGTEREDWIMRTGRGQTGVDAECIGPDNTNPGFRYAELKPATDSGLETFEGQMQNWNLPEGETKLWGYDEGGNTFPAAGPNF